MFSVVCMHLYLCVYIGVFGGVQNATTQGHHSRYLRHLVQLNEKLYAENKQAKNKTTKNPQTFRK